MNTWRDPNPGFDYREWNDSDLSALRLVNRNVYERYMSEGIYDGAADVARVEILHRIGGINVDADSVAVKPIDDELLEGGFFAVREPENGMEEQVLVGNACMGAVAGHPVLERYVEAISRVVDVRPKWRSRALEPSQTFWHARWSPISKSCPAWAFYGAALDGSAVLGGEPFGRHL